MLTRAILLDKPTHALGVTQIINWGILFYTPALLSKPIARDLGVDVVYIYAAFSWSLLLGGLVAAPVGKALDLYGGRIIMSFGVIFAAISLLFWAISSGLYSYFFAATLIGFAMRFTLYEAAFASLVEMYGAKSRPFITIVTLHGALASSIIWLVTFYLEKQFGWRITLVIFAFSMVIISLPLHWFYLPKKQEKHDILSDNEQKALIPPEKRRKAIILFAFSLMLSSFAFSSLSIHLITFLEGLGLSLSAAVFIASTKGIAQLIGRLAELLWGQKIHPIHIAIYANIMLVLSFLCLFFAVSPLVALLYCFFYGIGQGLLTIVRGALPVVLFGRKGYGELMGKIVTPSLVITAFSPLLFGIFMEQYGVMPALYLLLAFSGASLLSMMLLKRAL